MGVSRSTAAWIVSGSLGAASIVVGTAFALARAAEPPEMPAVHVTVPVAASPVAPLETPVPEVPVDATLPDADAPLPLGEVVGAWPLPPAPVVQAPPAPKPQRKVVKPAPAKPAPVRAPVDDDDDDEIDDDD